MRATQAAPSGAVGRDGGSYRMWISKTLAVMLVGLSTFPGACGLPLLPEKDQTGQEDSLGPQESQIEEGRQDSTTARSGPGAYTTLAQLSPPKSYSEDAGLRNVQVRGTGDFYAPAPSGATFTIKNERRSVSVTFTPSFLSKTPAQKTDGVTFKVWSGKQRVYQEYVRPDDPAAAVALSLPKTETADKLTLSFVTKAGPSGNRAYDWAIWRDVRIDTGESEGKGKGEK